MEGSLLCGNQTAHPTPTAHRSVQANPAFCCPSIVTEAINAEIESVTGVPVVTITYDGIGAPKNDVVIPYIPALRPAAALQS